MALPQQNRENESFFVISMRTIQSTLDVYLCMYVGVCHCKTSEDIKVFALLLIHSLLLVLTMERAATMRMQISIFI